MPKMPLIVGEGESKEFEHPPAALYQAVCCDVINRGEMMTKAGTFDQRSDRLAARCLELQGRALRGTETYTRSLFDKGPGQAIHLAHDLQSWRGIPSRPRSGKPSTSSA